MEMTLLWTDNALHRITLYRKRCMTQYFIFLKKLFVNAHWKRPVTGWEETANICNQGRIFICCLKITARKQEQMFNNTIKIDCHSLLETAMSLSSLSSGMVLYKNDPLVIISSSNLHIYKTVWNMYETS